MRGLGFWGLVLLGLAGVAVVGGCHSTDTQGQPWFRHAAVGWFGPNNSEQIEIALIQDAQPSHYLAEGVWLEVDEQALPPDTQARLEANGLRLGRLQGSGSSKLLALLADQGSCPRAERLTAAQNHETKWKIRAIPGQARLSLTPKGEPHTCVLERPEFGLALRLTPAENGKTLLELEPTVRYQSADAKLLEIDTRQRDWKLAGTDSPELRLPDLRMQISLGQGDYWVMGARADRPATYGGQAFLDPASNQQFLLVIRGVGKNDLAMPAGSGPLPLALQTLISPQAPVATVPRGQSP